MQWNRIFVLIGFVFGFSFLALSCKESKDEVAPLEELEQVVTLDKETAELAIEEELILTPSFGTFETPKRTYSWSTDAPDILDLFENEDYSVKIKAKEEGEAQVTLKSEDGELQAECTITVIDAGDGVIRILAIGNSFSQDAIENYLYDLAKAENIKVEIGNLYIGGASLDKHWTNVRDDNAVYQYIRIDENGNKTNTRNTSIATALAHRKWDYISFQQHSPASGQYNTYIYPLPKLFDYVSQRATNPRVKYVLHQTWAYEQTSTHAGFANYNKDQMTMYRAIVDAVWRVKDLVSIDLVVPAGTAIQNGRTSAIGDNFCRDGYHLDLNIGRYTAACTWFEAIFNKSVVGNSFKPTALSDYEAEIAQHAAHFASIKPKEVTVMDDYQDAPDPIEFTEPIFIGFGNDTPVTGWNGLHGTSGNKKGATIHNMKDKNGSTTGTSLIVTEEFNGRNTNGEKSTSTEFNIPSSISSYNCYGNSGEPWGNKEIKQSTFKITGLIKEKKYNFCFFSSRTSNNENESREVKFISKGKNEVVVHLESINNKSNIVCANDIEPDDNGEIFVTVTAGDKNNNQYGFFHLTAMRISPAN